MTNLIGISGKAGSGKDLVASIIQYLVWKNTVEKILNKSIHHSLKDFIKIPSLAEALSRWQVVKYADKLKDIVCLLTGCTREQLEDQRIKSLSLQELVNEGIISQDFVNLLDDE